MKQVKAKILENNAEKIGRMRLSAPAIAKDAKPGQFVMARSNDKYQPLLRRPFSIHRAKRSYIEILYEVVGEATEILTEKRAGEYLDIIGPLGNGFDIKKGRPILAAGGVGVAALLLLAERLKKQKPIVLLGARTKSHILCEKEFRVMGCDVKIATDDGSKGYKGFVTDLLNNLLSTMACPGQARDYRLWTIYACGPHAMLKAVAEISRKRNIPAQVSLEAHMACGIGACLGCIVNTTQGHKRVCKEGPVFDVKEIIWQ